ncbi:DUF4935 domain-containing protein [Bradyrhizobium sp. WSM 1738]|nr:DUF4935 domain-containing protein [Bradyrhizobium hereditatis]
MLRRYFTIEPPFSRGELKKTEFPDALALLSLEAWASRHHTTVLLVSRDTDWQAFAAASKHLVVIADLSAALDCFNAAGSFAEAKCLACSHPRSSLNSGWASRPPSKAFRKHSIRR